LFFRFLSSVRLFVGQSPWRNRYTQGAAKLAFSVMLAQGITFLGSLILARFFYPPETQDQMAGFLWLFYTLTPLSTMRYDIGIVVPKGERGASQIFRLSVLSALVLAGVSIPVIIVCGLLNFGSWSNLLWVPVSILTQGFTNTFIGWCNRRHFFGMQSTTRVILAAFYPLLAVIFFIIWGPRAPNLPAAFTLASLLGATIFALLLHRTGTLPSLSWASLQWRRLIHTATRYRHLPLLNVPSYTLNMISLVVLVSSLQNFSAGTSASFNLIYQILRVPAMLVGMAIGQVFTAKAATLLGNSRELRRLILVTLCGLSVLAIPFGLLFTFWGKSIIALVYGPAWSDAGAFSCWLVWGAACALITSPLNVAPSLLNGNRGQLILTIVIAGSRCLLSWFTIRGESPWLLVIGSSCIDVVATMLFVWFILKLVKTPATPPPLQPATASAH
jgi:O-antigen/teichoic acid export membrane protein